MKIAVIVSDKHNISSDITVPPEHQVEFLPLYSAAEFSDSAVLKEFTFSEKSDNFDAVFFLPPEAEPEQINTLLSVLPDSDQATALAISSSRKSENLSKAEQKSVLLLQLLTGEQITDFENPFRLYPVKLLKHIPESMFDDDYFYIKILIKASKAGYRMVSVENNCGCETDRTIPEVSFFMKELMKNLLPLPGRRLCPRNFAKEKAREFLMHPMKFLKFLIRENATPGGLALAAATGMFIGTLPLFGIHTASIIYVSIKLRLNKMLSVNISHLCMPPFVPFACIEIGHYMLNGKWLTVPPGQFVQAAFREIDVRLFEWVLGSLILAPVNALAFAGLTYIISTAIRKSTLKKKASL